MKENKNLSGEFGRYSSGPLYSKSELAKTEKYLAGMGLTEKKDNATLGMRMYFAPGKELAGVSIYLHEAGLEANSPNSGIMLMTDAKGEAKVTSVWDFAKEQSIAHTKNPVLRKIRQTLGI